MVSIFVQFLPVAMQAAQILKAGINRFQEATPQEREEIGRHLLAIYYVLEGAAEREQEPLDAPALSPAAWNVAVLEVGERKHEQLRQSIRQFVRAVRRLQSKFAAEERREILFHLSEIKRILADIDRRARNR